MTGRLNSTRGTAKQEDDLESVTSFASGPSSVKPTIKYAWSGNAQVDHDSYHRMLEQYKAAKEKQAGDELKIRQLAAQLARTEEAAKRALTRSDQGVKGSTVQQLLDAQRQIQQLQADNHELSSKLAREKKRANEFRAAAEENKRRLEAALREQRALVRKLGEAERSLGGSAAARTAARNTAAEHEYWSEEAGRRFAVQQEELLNLREQVQHQQQQLAAAVPAESVARYEATIRELQQQVHFYQQQLISPASPAPVPVIVDGQDSTGPNSSWPLETIVENGACFLWERSTGRVFTDAADGQWPRPVGIKTSSTSSIKLGSKGRFDSALNGLADALHIRAGSPAIGRSNHGHSELSMYLQQLTASGRCASGSCSNVAAGVIDMRDLPALLQLMVPGLAYRELPELVAWLALPQQLQGGNGQGLLLADLEIALRELLTAHDAVRRGHDMAVNEALMRVRRLLRQEPKLVAAAWGEADTQGSGLSSIQIVELLKQQQFMPDLSPTEATYLHMLLHEWDVRGNVQHSLADLYAALQLVRVTRAPVDSSPGGPEATDARFSTTSGPAAGRAQDTADHTDYRKSKPGPTGSNQPHVPGNSKIDGPPGQGGPSLRETYLTQRIAELEQQLEQAKLGKPGSSNQQVDALKADLARYQSRVTELLNDFASLDVVVNTDVGDYDAEMRKAWFTAAAFKKRYVEHKAELETIKATAEKMQATLDETHRALHAEAARRMALEEAAAVARIEATRAKELATAVAAERAERLKLERDYLELQSKAFAAPGGALAEVRTLREELLAARRERAVGEAREADLRREIAALKRQFEGISPEEHRRLAAALTDAQKRCVTCELEQRAALDKLEVYRRTEAAAHAAADASTSDSNKAAAAPAGSVASHADEGKSEPELRAELSHLRQVIVQDAEELDKLHKLLDTEAAISLEAKAALEEAQTALQAARAEAAQQLAKLRRELDNKDEHIRKLEAQLRGAYSGLTRAAMRASAAAANDRGPGSLRVSRIGVGGDVMQNASLEDVVRGLAQHENVIELVVAEAVLLESEVSADISTFLAWDFFLHDSQATPLATGISPAYNTTVQYIVEADDFLLEYLTRQQLTFELFEAKGWDAAVLGMAHLPLNLLLQDLQVGAALGENRAWHHADILGSRGQKLGRLRAGFRVARPMDKLLSGYRAQQQGSSNAVGAVEASGVIGGSLQQGPRQQQQQHTSAGVEHATDVLMSAAQQAEADPASASYLQISIHGCEELTSHAADSGSQQHHMVQRPYVHYLPPGRSVGHDTAVGSGPSPAFNDAASWSLMKSAALTEALKSHHMQVAVFDDAMPEPSDALIGTTMVPLASLAEGIPVEGVFTITHPDTGQAAGMIQLSVAWHNPLATAAAGARQLVPRIPLLDPGAAQVMRQQHGQDAAREPQEGPGITEQPNLLQQVPMLSAARDDIPSTSAAAAAAVGAVLHGRQQHELPLLRGDPTLQPAAAFASSRETSGPMLLLSRQSASNTSRTANRYTNSPVQHSHGLSERQAANPSVLSRQPAPERAAGTATTAENAASKSSHPQPQQHGTELVLRRVKTDSTTWSDLDTTVYFRVDSLTLSTDALADPALQHLLLAHMFCEDFTSAAQQCTETIPKGVGSLPLDYAVAYTIADPVTKVPTAAGAALARSLAAADSGEAARMVLPVLLASSRTPMVTDFSQVECVATCEVDLSAMWEGASTDLIQQDYYLLPATERAQRYPSGAAGVVRLTVVAVQAFDSLKRVLNR